MAYTLNSLEKKLKDSKEARDTIRAMLAIKRSQKNDNRIKWSGLFAVPPSSSMERVLKAFVTETDIPLELPFFTFLYFISGYLVSKDAKIKSFLGEFYPDIWTVVLAPSGSGKTLTHDVFKKHAPAKSNFPEPASGAAFIKAFEENNPARWFQDEVAQKLKQIETTGSPLADCKEYLLRAYGNDKIERTTKRDQITIEKPLITILGLNTFESFVKALSAESLLDGFAQRFAFVIAEKDPARPMIDFPLYNFEKLESAVIGAFEKLTNTTIHQEYELDSSSIEAFRQSFKLLCRDNIPESFFRRIMFRAFKYALIYHVMLGKDSNKIDAEDIGWGARVSSMHIDDIHKIVKTDEGEKTLDLITRAINYIEKRINEGKEVKARDVQMNVKGVKTAEQAKIFLGMFDESELKGKVVDVQPKAPMTTTKNEVDEAFGWIDNELNNCLG
ncbi:hypothetical protein QZM42_18670 [Burkholderia vietnamiensis]|uniref:hypothetical protein n=1 Tax=Burkholderia vietnamiensis TaxID=60552 RepID=UPI0026564FC9|nr:hypothetical protein [Burkholderia vietnamiensis]MDN7410567.1 hypothetical protein [Burkholderia vietnamiensis]